MFEVSEKAKEMVKEFLKDRPMSPVRIMPSIGGWGTPSLAMALDESQESDEVFDEHGLSFVVDRQLFEMAKPIRIDFTMTYKGGEFAIYSSILENTCSLAEDIHSCQSSCSI